MGLISSTVSVSRYHVEGKFEDSVMESVKNGLVKHTIPAVESEYDEILTGWTSYENPYSPDFETDPFVFGSYFLFSMRIDKKSVPLKLIQKHMAIETRKKLEQSGREFLSKNEKSELKDLVTDNLLRQVPSVPSIYDILWDYESSNLYLFSTQKAANEFFQTLFVKSFDLKPFNLFPYTIIETKSGFSAPEKDDIYNLSLIKYSR
ncbi:MAG: exonuclease [Desulfobacteraceae bacterium]|nr:MAG: exonuclease [Desulfobacteraceae bacterium]